MLIDIHPTEADYRHALIAHRTWVTHSIQKGGWRVTVVRILGAGGLAAFGIVGGNPTLISNRHWTISAASLIGALSYFPLALVISLTKNLLTTPASLRPAASGVTERIVASKGGGKATSWIPTYAWIVLLVASSIVFMRRGNLFGGSTTPAHTAVESPTTETVSGPFLFWMNLLICGTLSSLVVRLQKRRAVRNLLVSTPALLLPRTWEFTDQTASERGELLQTTMKWEYIHKFLETPDVVMLYSNEQTFFLVPRAAFTSDLQYAGFIGLLMQKVPNGIMQPRGGQGFAVRPLPAIPIQ